MSLEIKKIKLRNDLDFLNKQIDTYQNIISLTKNIDLKINLLHLLNYFIKEREIILDKFDRS